MVQVVCKYTLPTSGIVSMPVGAKLLKLDWQEDSDAFVLWAIVDKEATILTPIQFYAATTGQDLPDRNLHYVTTVEKPNGVVYHWFMVLAGKQIQVRQ